MFFTTGWRGAGMQWLGALLDSCATVRRAGYTIYPESSRLHRWRRMRFWLRSLVCWRATSVWLKRCTTAPLLDLVRRHPSTLERMHRPFLHAAFGPHERLAASLDHYAFVQQRVPLLASRIAAEGRAQIARFSVGAEDWSVSLESTERFQREGEWTVCIRDALDRCVVSCTFSIAYLGGKVCRPRMWIGSVQGPSKAVNGRELFRALTKRWHGLRPKFLVIYLAQCVARTLDVRGTFIVSKRAHIYANWRYWLRKSRVSADYDGLAREYGAFTSWNGWFVLAPPALDLAGRQGNAMRRKRQALKTSVAAQIAETVALSIGQRDC
ncbi:DUF535 family protein [Burkholderia alba]|uniref:DUF535 family protein n=1 Tax=Burkholderia alba TaxID=2683677 RepID=UPI002B055B51|nr:DUF535 family protein [Burkholderia alba]